ncbi:MAG: hypothetical protein KGH65_02530 [Candidatus Micrarchaeota archaeon]|nr:hypothetical protein [Candidatus Micrarchaeota archaeon]
MEIKAKDKTAEEKANEIRFKVATSLPKNIDRGQLMEASREYLEKVFEPLSKKLSENSDLAANGSRYFHLIDDILSGKKVEVTIKDQLAVLRCVDTLEKTYALKANGEGNKERYYKDISIAAEFMKFLGYLSTVFNTPEMVMELRSEGEKEIQQKQFTGPLSLGIDPTRYQTITESFEHAAQMLSAALEQASGQSLYPDVTNGEIRKMLKLADDILLKREFRAGWRELEVMIAILNKMERTYQANSQDLENAEIKNTMHAVAYNLMFFKVAILGSLNLIRYDGRPNPKFIELLKTLRVFTEDKIKADNLYANRIFDDDRRFKEGMQKLEQKITTGKKVEFTNEEIETVVGGLYLYKNNAMSSAQSEVEDPQESEESVSAFCDDLDILAALLFAQSETPHPSNT